MWKHYSSVQIRVERNWIKKNELQEWKIVFTVLIQDNPHENHQKYPNSVKIQKNYSSEIQWVEKVQLYLCKNKQKLFVIFKSRNPLIRWNTLRKMKEEAQNQYLKLMKLVNKIKLANHCFNQLKRQLETTVLRRELNLLLNKEIWVLLKKDKTL